MAESEDAPDTGGGDHGLHGTAGGQKAFGALVLGVFKEAELVFIGHTGADSFCHRQEVTFGWLEDTERSLACQGDKISLTYRPPLLSLLH